MEQVYITRPSQDKPGMFECFNTMNEQATAAVSLEQAERWAIRGNMDVAQARELRAAKDVVLDNIFAILKDAGEVVEIETGTDWRGCEWRSVNVYDPVSTNQVRVLIDKMNVRGNVFRISMPGSGHEHTRSKPDGSVSAEKVLALVKSAKDREAASHRRAQAYYASRNSVQQVVETTDSLLDKYGDGRLQNLGMNVSVDTERYGTGVKVTLSGHMTAERAAAIIKALSNLDVTA